MSVAQYASGTLAAQNDAVTIGCVDAGTVGVSLQGTWTGTVTFEATLDNSNWVAIKGTPLASVTSASTSTSTGIFQVPVSGMNLFRVRLSTAGTGSLNVVLSTSNSAVTKY